MNNAMLGAFAKPSADPYLPQQDIADFCEDKGILIEAYSPLGSTGSPLFQEEGVKEVAKKHNVGAGTVLLSYQGIPARKIRMCRSQLTMRSEQGPCRPRQVRHAISNRGEYEDHKARLIRYRGA
jgi:hypothetical protein